MRSSSVSLPLAQSMAWTEKLPSVRVPVLSKTMVEVLANCSSTTPPLMTTPSFAAAPMPEKKLSGTEMTSAHGQEMTRKVSALVSHSAKGWWKKSGGIAASSTAAPMTDGV